MTISDEVRVLQEMLYLVFKFLEYNGSFQDTVKSFQQELV